MILPMVKYLESYGVQFHFGVKVTNVEFDCHEQQQACNAHRHAARRQGRAHRPHGKRPCVHHERRLRGEFLDRAARTRPLTFNTELNPRGGGWDMWRKIAAQDPSFGHPDKFCSDPEQTNWMSATVETLDDRIIPYIKNICKRDPFTGQGRHRRHCLRQGLLLALKLDDQPPAAVPRSSRRITALCGSTGLFTDKPGDFVKKPMRECTGKEICMEWLYHIGVPEDEIEELAARRAPTPCPCMMPYIDRILHAARLRRPPGRCARRAL